MDDNLPVVNMEVSSGTFRIKTQEAIYQITVTPDSSLARVVEKVVEREAPAAAPAAGSAADDPFYREMTEEMYSEIGRLARQLSLSIKEIPGQSFKGLDIQSAGVELEDAKGQLEDIVQMTEKATMDIMDLAESIQEELADVQGRLTGIKELEFMSRSEGDVDPDLDWGVEPSTEDETSDAGAGAEAEQAAAFLETVIQRVTGLREAVAGLPRQEAAEGAPEPAPAAPEPAAPTVRKTYHFDTDVVFQTLYELCTNETVKDHIKLMRGEQETAFDTEAVQAALGEMATNVDVEDNFFNFPISNILKALFAASKVDKHKQILKKMNQTAGNIFLDTVLPVEGEVQETEVAAPAPEPAPAQPAAPASPCLPAEQIDQLLEMIDENIGLLEAEKEKLAQAAADDDMGGMETGTDDPPFTRVKQGDREQIIDTVEGASELIQDITSHLTRILEALAFQDLSGQRILKIVRLISDVQVQLLSILVSFGARMKKRKEAPEMAEAAGDGHDLAQSEVDKMLEQVGGSTLEGPEAEGRLDQGKVDDLLADLGF